MKTSIYLLALLSCILLPEQLLAQTTTGNYIRKKTYTNDSGTTCIQTTVYYNDDGKKVQTVEKGITPDGKDLIHIFEYDVLGRECRVYYPVAKAGEGNAVNIGSDSNNLPSVTSTDHPMTETTYEFSPLDRILSVLGLGKAWYDNNKAAKTDYHHNSPTGEYACAYFYLSGNNIIRHGVYPENSLQVTVATDENGIATYTFTDKMDRTILQRQIISADVFTDTYYLYNPFGLLIYVLPPEASVRMSADVTCVSTHEAIRNYACFYEYDDLLRQVGITAPGCDPTYTIYDAGWRPAFTQIGEQRLRNEWSYTCYDALSRIVEEGTFVTTNSRASLTSILSSLYDISSVVSGGSIWLKRNYYDSYSFLAGGDSELNYNVRSGYGTRYVNMQGGVDIGSKGQLCGTCVRVLSTDGSTAPIQTTAFYYDIHGRVIQQKSNVLPDGYDKVYFQYNFSGNPLLQLTEHTTVNRGNISERYRYEYDQAELEIKQYYLLNGNAEILLSETAYTDIGEVKEERLHNNMEQISYTYNLRSWVEKQQCTRSSNSQIDFEQELFYADHPSPGGTPYYNGNVSAYLWKCGNEPQVRGYSFAYDRLNRLSSSTYGEGNTLSDNVSRYNESQSYDKMGNILSILRNGKRADGSFGPVDNVTLTYTGNQLKKVTNTNTLSVSPGVMHFIDGVDQDAEYIYNKNGSLKQDLNKGITDIQYNLLNLPQKISYSNGNSADYLYLANGNEAQVNQVSGSVVHTTDYNSNLVYRDHVLAYILTSKGYVTLDGTTPTYHYYLKDHLGNNRMVLDQNGMIEETSHYYPFGCLFSDGTNVQPYKYNGKELDTTNNLNWYDYGARHYDAVLGRWHVVDPMAEKLYGVTPCNYCVNNPVLLLDPNGMWSIRSGIKRSLNSTLSLSLSFANGAIVAVADNMFLGTITLRETGIYSSASAYNAGQDVGDAISMVLGSLEVAKGATEMVGGVIAASETAGITLTFEGINLS